MSVYIEYPKVESLPENNFLVTCSYADAKFLLEYMRTTMKIDYTKALINDEYYPSLKELCFILPIITKENIPEGRYEYLINRNACAALQDYVSNGETRYEAQYMGGSGDEQYYFLKPLIDISEAVSELFNDYENEKYSMVSKRIEGTKNAYRTEKVPAFCNNSWLWELIPKNCKAEVQLWADSETLRDFEEIAGSLLSPNLQYIFDEIKRLINNKDEENTDEL